MIIYKILYGEKMGPWLKEIEGIHQLNEEVVLGWLRPPNFCSFIGLIFFHYFVLKQHIFIAKKS